MEQSQPVDFDELFDVDELQKLQDQFANAFAIASIITDTNGKPITRPSNFSRLCQNIIRCTEKGLQNCMRSDALIGRHNPEGPVVQTCLSGGLWDAGASITVGGQHVANWLIGQVRNDVQQEEKIIEYAREIGADEADFLQAFREIPIMSENQFQKISELLFTMANQLSEMAFQNLQQAKVINERKNAEEAFREEEDKFRTTLYSIGDGVITTDPEGRIKLMNPIAERLTGWSQADAMGKPLEEVFEIINEETRTQVEIPVRKVLREGVIVGLANHTLLIAKNGTERPIADSGAPIRNSKGEITGVVLVFRDQTEERLAEKALRESEEKFRRIVESSPIGKYMYQLQEDGSLIFRGANPAADRIIGIDHQKLLGKTIQQAFPELVKTNVPEMYTRIAKGELGNQFFEIEYHDKEINGYYQITVFNAGKNLIVVDFFDISDRKKSEIALKESKDQLQLSLKINNASVFENNLETGDAVITPELFEFLGYAPDEIPVTIEDVLKLIHSEDIQSVNQSVADYLAGKSPEYFAEFRLRTRSGKWRWVDGRGKIVKWNEKGEPTILLGISRDIHERKEFEQQQFGLLKIIENSLNEIYVFDMETLKFEYVNQGGLKNLGYSLAEMKQLTPIDIKPEYSWNTFKAAIYPLISGEKEKLVFETIHQRKNGTEYPVEVYLQLHSQNGHSVFFAIINDITSRRLAEKALKESEEKFRNLFENAAVGISMTGIDGTIRSNKTFGQMLGYSPEEMQTKNWKEITHPDDIQIGVDLINSILQKKTDHGRFEKRYIHKNGSIVWAELNTILQRDANDKPLYFITSISDITEKKKTVDAIQNERQLLRTLIDNLPFSIYVKDLECRKVVANLTDVEKMGYTREAEVLGKTDIELFEGESGVPSYNDDLLVVKQGHSIINREEYFPNPEGGIRWTVTTKIPLFDQSGKIVGMVGIGRDITEQKNALGTIQKLSKSIEQSPSTIVITDAQGIIEYVNPRFSEVTGYLPEEVIGQMLRMLKPGNINPEQLEELWKTINSGETWRGEITNRKKNKTKYLDSVVVTPVLDEHKRIINILIICEDITSQKREEKLKEVIQSITHDGSVAKDLIDFTSNVKNRLEDLIDLTNFYLALYDESKDMFWIPAYYDQCDDIETFAAEKTITAYVLRSKKSLLADRNEIRKLKDSGVIESLGVPAQVWMGVPLMVGEKAIGVLAVQSYDNPLLYNEQDKLLLERVAHEVSYIIQRIKSDEEVKRALEKAEESDRLKSAFLANMSHEIRTPLNSIIGFSELLADAEFEFEQKNEFVQHIITSGNQLLNIISDIVDISKIESGEIVIRKTELQVKRLLDEVRALHIIKVESKLLHFRFNCPENITEITIWADKERLHQVFNNLISNALKFTSEGFIELGCKLHGEMLEFYVKDTGIGIDPKFHSKIFERFRQVETAFTRKFGGNGLGLAITKHLVELMGGRIWLESEKGKGSTFFFTVQLVQQ